MSTGWLGSWFGGKRPAAKDAREAIVNLRQHLLMLEKKEEHLNSKIADETTKAKSLLTTNKRLATQALRNKKMYESELEKIEGRKMTLEQQVNAIESANMNMETMRAMRQGADVLKGIHGNLNIDKVDTTMDSIREQMDLTNEISEAISTPHLGNDLVDEDELAKELEELQQEELDKALVGAGGVPVTNPGQGVGLGQKAPPVPQTDTPEMEDEEEELRKLRAELAM